MDIFNLAAKISLDSSEYEKGVKNASKSFSNLGDKLKTGLTAAAKVGAAAVAAGGAAIVAVGKQAVSAYAEYEQLVGGVETLFGTSREEFLKTAQASGMSVQMALAEYEHFTQGSDIVLQNAAKAYKTAGLSANEYMQTVTSFSASLLQSLGGDTVAAAAYADKAVTDMSDNANKMGTDMSSIQAAYQGFAKQNYTMLDNLKLGYGGTKTEMERLITDAENLDSTFQATRDANGDLTLSYADIVDAIHIVQDEMGITGTTAKEASTTIQGSIASAKAAYQNWLTGLADENADIEQLTDELFQSIETAANNLIPVIERVLESLGKTLKSKLPELLSRAISFVVQHLPDLISLGFQLIGAVIEGLGQGFATLLPLMLNWLNNNILQPIIDIWEQIKQALRDAWEFMKQDAIQSWTETKENVLAIITNIKQKAVDSWNNLKSRIENIGSNIKSSLINTWASIKSSVISTVENIFSAVTEKFDRIKNSITEKIQSARDTLSGIIDGIKDLFNFSWTLPHISLPHFSWSWNDLGVISLPSISVSWYKKAYDTPYLFNKPTLAGFGDGNGDEMVYGRDSLMRDIREAVGGGQMQVTINVYPQKGQSEEEIARAVQKKLVMWENQRKAAFA